MDDAPVDAPSPEGHLGSALLYCDQCGEETPHRIFRVRRGSAVPGGGALSGVARCRNCRATHPFESRAPERRELSLIVSDGPRSARRTLSLAPAEQIRRGEPVPGVEENVVVRKIDGKDGRAYQSAAASEVATIWGTREVGAAIRVSVVEGARTRPARLVVPPKTPFEVGGSVTVDGDRLTITALRARGKTWRIPGDRFPAAEIQRLYGRRTVRPPAGRSDWRRGRGTPSERTSSSSRADRSRSSPGVRSTRTSPRARTAAGGATVQRSWSR